ncbi:helix-turn-helix domain-containing protein [Hydrogenophaga sp.]|uniref:helix-turn-helix domain-containing protein n=1 Tax=Hydrogenophaga sp. TaxID=1904254 RepID=UPI0027318ED4|nr:helix-turn-helix domain-containing protein [Hydrogenophaga sp.]MDP2015619.1 helix-turn-helix domain-containing protein [Hydrogenophaga sp.]
MKLAELGHLIHDRREALGLSQDRLAKLGGLSRATINQLENGTLVDLGAAKLIGLFNLVGIELDATPHPPKANALALLSQTASVSYKSALEPAVLAKALIGGELPRHIAPHVATLLDEAPLQLILAAVEQVAKRSNTPPKTLWKHLVNWAHELHSPRAVWA